MLNNGTQSLLGSLNASRDLLMLILTDKVHHSQNPFLFIQTLWTFVIFALKGLASRECFLVDHEKSGLYLYLCVGVLNLLVGFLRRGAAGERKINHGASLPWGK